MLEALTHTTRFVEGRRREDLDEDAMLAFALLYALQTVGEAANNISEEMRRQHPNVQWPVIIGMRHRVVHAYANVNRDILWRDRD